MRSTVTVRRRDEQLTIVVSHGVASPDRIILAVDENGDGVRLDAREREEALERARRGEDETGR